MSSDFNWQQDAKPALDRLTSQMQAIRDRQAVLYANAPVRAADDWAGQREDYNTEREYWNAGGPEMALTENLVFDTDDAGPVPVRIYRPNDIEPGGPLPPVVIFTHGGGWILGNLDTHDRMARNFAANTGAVVVSIDYSLSPEAKFPVPLNQCVGVIEYVVAHATELGVDVSNIAFAGDSAGAYFALAETLALAAKGSPIKPSCLLLVYGVFGMVDSPARRLLGGPWDGMARDDLLTYWNAYIDNPEDLRNPLVDVLSGDLSVLPPTYIAAAELDPAKDDSYTLAALLARLGTPVELSTFNGVLHGYLHYTRDLDEAKQTFAEIADFYRKYAR
jgi:acetyl esterase